jgi:hypothetical protein
MILLLISASRVARVTGMSNQCPTQVFFFFFFVVLGLELRAYTSGHSVSPFLWFFFRDRVSQTICLGWLWTSILLISASWVVMIIGVSHWCPTQGLVLDGGRPPSGHNNSDSVELRLYLGCSSLWVRENRVAVAAWGQKRYVCNFGAPLSISPLILEVDGKLQQSAKGESLRIQTFHQWRDAHWIKDLTSWGVSAR